MLLASASFAVLATPAAHAATSDRVTVNNMCMGYNINTDPNNGFPLGSTLDLVLNSAPPFPLAIKTSRISGPTEVNAGTTFNGEGKSVQVPVPAQVDTKITDLGIGIDGGGVVNVASAANIIITIHVAGAASVGAPTISGGDAIGSSVTKNGSDIILKMPGTRATQLPNFELPTLPGQIIPGDEHEFVTGKSFAEPKLNIPVTAGAAGSTITFKMTKLQADSDAEVFAGSSLVPVRAICDPNDNLLGSVQVVNPPPPGAPDAVADVAQTDEGKPVTVSVLENDTPNAQLAIDEDSLAVTANPGHGTAAVNADHTITYTPADGFFGGDSFTYKLCSVPEEATTTTTTQEPPALKRAAVAQKCDTAKVTITVNEAEVVIETPNTAAPTTPTTVAAAAELPRTGSSSAPLGLIGGTLMVGGLSIVGLAARRRASA
jgi:LPXTG-motif cell wall-anchored protein